MWKAMKKGFGLAIGVCFGYGLFNAIADEFLRWRASDDEYMEDIKTRKPDVYEDLKKYRVEEVKEESVEEEGES